MTIFPHCSRAGFCDESNNSVVADQAGQPYVRLEPELLDDNGDLMNLDPDRECGSLQGSDPADKDDEEWRNWRVDDPEPDPWVCKHQAAVLVARLQNLTWLHEDVPLENDPKTLIGLTLGFTKNITNGYVARAQISLGDSLRIMNQGLTPTRAAASSSSSVCFLLVSYPSSAEYPTSWSPTDELHQDQLCPIDLFQHLR